MKKINIIVLLVLLLTGCVPKITFDESNNATDEQPEVSEKFVGLERPVYDKEKIEIGLASAASLILDWGELGNEPTYSDPPSPTRKPEPEITIAPTPDNAVESEFAFNPSIEPGPTPQSPELPIVYPVINSTSSSMMPDEDEDYEEFE